MLNPYKKADEWLDEVIDERIREVFKGREKIERFLTKSELVAFDRELVENFTFEKMRGSVLRFLRSELSQLKSVREVLRIKKKSHF